MLHLRPRMSMWLRGAGWTLLLAVAVAVGTLSGQSAARQSSSAPAPQITFNRDIAPIIFRSCAACHRPAEAAPFSLLDYSGVKKHARQIAEVTQSRAMPPWLPEPQKLKLADELR